MIVLDTNVLSEAVRPSPSKVVLHWLAEQDRDAVFTTAVNQAEILYGVEILPAGKRRSQLSAAIERLFAQEFANRILPFDEDAARVFCRLVPHRQKLGRPISQFDAMIASICRARGLALATRNGSDFEHLQLHVIDPWKS